MSNNLEKLIQPGERILYQSQQNWLCSETAPYVAANLYCIAFLGAVGLVAIDTASLVALASVVFSFLGFSLQNYPRNAPSEAMVTDRRLVQRCGLFNSRIFEVPVAAVKEVAAHEDALLIFNRNGKTIQIRHPNSSFGLGVALAHVADIRPPEVPRRLESFMTEAWMTCVVLTSLLIGTLALKWLFLTFGTTIFSFSLILGIGVFALGGFLANVAAVFLGPLLFLVLSRPFLSYDRLRHWMDCSIIFWPDPEDRSGDSCFEDLHLWYAGWLYLRPAADAERQG